MDKAWEGGPPSVIKYNEIYHTIGQNVTISTIGDSEPCIQTSIEPL